MQLDKTCRFCFPPEKYRIIKDTQNFYVMLSLGPIVEGYSLIVSKQHISCVADIPSHMQAEFIKLYYHIRESLSEIYGSVICYEHGQAGSCLSAGKMSSSHCHHAHMHCVPANVSIGTEVEKTYNGKQIESIISLHQQFTTSQSPYLFVHDDCGMQVFHVNDSIERQFLRKIVARQINNGNSWNWADEPNLELIQSALSRLKPNT